MLRRIRTIPKAALLACIVWFMFCAAIFSDAGTSLTKISIAVALAGIWMAVWLIRLLIYARRRHISQPHSLAGHSFFFWAIEPTVLVACVALSVLGVFSYARFAVSESSLNSYAENVRAGKVDLKFEFNRPPRHMGLYTITQTDLLPDGTVRMITSSNGLLDKAGFTNSPVNPPPKQGEDSYQRIHGQWWIGTRAGKRYSIRTRG